LICSKTKDDAFIQSQKLFRENINVLPGTSPNELLTGYHLSDEDALNWSVKIHLALTTLSAQITSDDSFNTEPEHVDKHKIQNDKIVERIMNLGNLPTRNFCVAEFGCGKGGLAATLMQQPMAKTWKFLLIDREARRNKAENRNRDVTTVRLRLDLKDTDLSLINTQAVFEEDITSMLICAKHLCGSATDLTLHAVNRSPVPVSLCVATCCHHACDWGVFVGAAIFQSIGLCSNADEFKAIRMLSGWATSTDGGLSKEKIQIGREAKKVVDLARCLWIQENLGKRVKYTAFIDPAVSPENYLILA